MGCSGPEHRTGTTLQETEDLDVVVQPVNLTVEDIKEMQTC